MYKFLALCVCLAGVVLAWALDTQLSATEKFTLAFPPSNQVKIALQDAESVAKLSGVSLKNVKSKYSDLLSIRYLACGNNQHISRLDSVKKIKKIAINSDCLDRENNALLQFLGMSQIGMRLSQSVLRPQIGLGKKTYINAPSNWTSLPPAFSSESGVAVLIAESNASEGISFISYDIKKGSAITRLKSIAGANISNISLSPNGRLLAVPAHQGHIENELVFLDTETGNILGRLDSTVGVQAWLSDVSSAIIKQSSGTISLADFVTGKISPYEVDSKVQNWGVTLSSSPPHVLVGSNDAFYLIQNERTSYGIKSKILKEFYPKPGLYSSHDSPLIMLRGTTAVFTHGDHLDVYDLSSGKQSQIETYPLFDKQFEKLDEELMLTKVSNSNGLKAFNLKDSSISDINDVISPNGILSGLNGRNGYLTKEPNQLWVGDRAKLGESKPLQTLISEKNSEKQLVAMVEKARDEREIALFGMPVDEEPKPENVGLIRLDATTGKMLQDASGKPVSGNNLQKDQTIKSDFLGSKIPKNTKYEFIGVKAPANDATKEIQITIQKSDRPILLFLSSCKTVKWKITKLPGSRLLGVFQQIEYVGQPFSSLELDNSNYATQQMMRIGYCAYEKASLGYQTLEREVLEKDGKVFEKFQGSSSGIAFSIGN